MNVNGGVFGENHIVATGGPVTAIGGRLIAYERQDLVCESNHILLARVDGTPHAMEQIRGRLLDVAVAQPLDLYAKFGAFYVKA